MNCGEIHRTTGRVVVEELPARSYRVRCMRRSECEEISNRGEIGAGIHGTTALIASRKQALTSTERAKRYGD